MDGYLTMLDSLPRSTERGRIEALCSGHFLLFFPGYHVQRNVDELKQCRRHSYNNCNLRLPRSTERGRIEASSGCSTTWLTCRRYHVQRNVDELKHDVVLDDAHGRVDGYHVQRNVDELKPLLAGTCRPPCDVTTFNGTWTN